MAVGVPEDVARVEALLLAPGGAFETEEVEVRGVTMPVFKNRMGTLRDLLLKSAVYGDKTYILATDGVLERGKVVLHDDDRNTRVGAFESLDALRVGDQHHRFAVVDQVPKIGPG
jgi:hypothetical protein